MVNRPDDEPHFTSNLLHLTFPRYPSSSFYPDESPDSQQEVPKLVRILLEVPAAGAEGDLGPGTEAFPFRHLVVVVD
jgi:hypothetical protein